MAQADPGFAARVARIEARRNRNIPAKPARRRFSIGYALSLVAAFLVGILVIFAARYARFHLTGITPGSARLDSSNLILDLGLAFLAGLILHQIFNFRRAEHTGAKSFGMFLGATAMHIPVHQYPAIFSVIFSEAWVNQVIRITDPTTLALF